MNFSRRRALQRFMAWTALPSFAHSTSVLAASAARHHTAKAERVIFVHLAGAPSTVDLFEEKPDLNKRDGELAPSSFFDEQKFAFVEGSAKLLAQKGTRRQVGDSGLWVSDWLPEMAKQTKLATVIRSMQTDQFNHQPADLMLYCGSPFPGRPTIGSWVSFALPEQNKSLPSFVVLKSGMVPRFSESPWLNGFLPSRHRGVLVSATGQPMPFLQTPATITSGMRRTTLALAAQLRQANQTDDRVQAEMAAAMEAALPEAMSLRSESSPTLAAYGIANDDAPSFARNCLVARRLCERGVRFVHLLDCDWDQHGVLDRLRLSDLPQKCHDVDRGFAALLADLDQRGMLDSTMVVWAGEFGRTPFSQTPDGNGRDHHPRCFAVWVAGGGFKRNFVFGETDELCWDVAANPVSVHDLQATILHLLGFDHTRLTYRHSGRDFRLTDVSGRVVSALLGT